VSPERNAYRFLVGTPEGKRPLGKLRRRQEANTTVVLKYNEREWSVFIWLRIGSSDGTSLSGASYLINSNKLQVHKMTSYL